MALGSSAPEILLSCIEIIGHGFLPGDLGPGTIVGSAAFNLFCITAVCVIGVPWPETRRIEAINVRHPANINNTIVVTGGGQSNDYSRDHTPFSL